MQLQDSDERASQAQHDQHVFDKKNWQSVFKLLASNQFVRQIPSGSGGLYPHKAKGSEVYKIINWRSI